MDTGRILSATHMPYDEYPDDRGLRYPVAFLYSLVVALFWLPAFAFRRIACSVRELGVDSWPRAHGSITSCNVTLVHGWVVDYALGRLDYSYRVAGQYYAGSVTRQYPDEQAAWDFVDAHRDKPVVVRYKDDKAETAALRDVDQDLAWNGRTEPGLLAMVWRHWQDELRRDPDPLDEAIRADEAREQKEKEEEAEEETTKTSSSGPAAH